AIELPAVCKDRRELVELGHPLRCCPVTAVKMAAAVAGNLMPLSSRGPDLAEPLHDVVTRFGKADIRTAGTGVWWLVDRAILPRDEIDAGEEIGEAGACLLRKRAAAVPLFQRAGAIKRDQYILRGGCFGFLRKSRAAGQDGQKGYEKTLEQWLQSKISTVPKEGAETHTQCGRHLRGNVAA